jgi:NADPH:quinone reductase
MDRRMIAGPNMRAAFYTEQGPAREVLRVGEQPTPQPGSGEVRVRLRTSGVNPSDWKSRRGGSGRKLSAPLVIPHSDGAGEIDAVGPGVSPSRVGERVWIWNGQWKRPFGTAAQFIALPSAQAVVLPETTDFAAGACLGIPALTALQAVRLAEVQRESVVLVSGGAGAVGHYAIQFAKLRGARVLATVSSDAKGAHARAAGADSVINYRSEDVGARARHLTDGRGVDAVVEVDLAANAKLLPAVLRPHGVAVAYGTGSAEANVPAQWLMLNSATVRLFLIYDISSADRAAVLDELGTFLRQRRLVHAVAKRVPLDAIAEAHEAVEQGSVIGNVVLDIP